MNAALSRIAASFALALLGKVGQGAAGGAGDVVARVLTAAHLGAHGLVEPP